MSDVLVIVVLALTAATPLVLAGLGELVLERTGVFNLGIEGTMLAAAFAAVWAGSWGGPWTGLMAGVGVGVVAGAVFAAALAAGIDQVVAGIALTILGTGASTFAFGVWVPAGRTNPHVSTVPAAVVGIGLSIGALTLLAVVATAVVWWLLRHTRFGLRVDAVGHAPDIATVRGLSVRGYRTAAALIAGGFAGAGGAAVSLAVLGSFRPHMTAAAGYLALVVVIVARRRPWAVPVVALLFAGFQALALRAQTHGQIVPLELLTALPYAVTLIALVWDGRRRSIRARAGRYTAP